VRVGALVARRSPDRLCQPARQRRPAAQRYFVIDADGSNLRNLSRHPAEDFDPKWTADGRSVVFASLRTGTSLLYEVSLDDGVTKPVSVHASHDMDHVTRPMTAAKRSL
jgi:TolB protein